MPAVHTARPTVIWTPAVYECLFGLLICVVPAAAVCVVRPQDFFETCAMLITVVILGKYMECQAKGKTSEAIQVRDWVGTKEGGRHAGRDVLAVAFWLVVVCQQSAVSCMRLSASVCGAVGREACRQYLRRLA